MLKLGKLVSYEISYQMILPVVVPKLSTYIHDLIK